MAICARLANGQTKSLLRVSEESPRIQSGLSPAVDPLHFRPVNLAGDQSTGRGGQAAKAKGLAFVFVVRFNVAIGPTTARGTFTSISGRNPVGPTLSKTLYPKTPNAIPAPGAGQLSL